MALVDPGIDFKKFARTASTSGRGRPPRSRSGKYLRTMGMIFMNPVPANNMTLQGQWVIPDVITSATLKGRNWEFYRSALAQMGYPSSAFIETTLSGRPAFQVGGAPYGEAALALCSLFDRVALGHWPSFNVIQRIRNLAADGGRQIKIGLYFVNYESINQGEALSEGEEVMRQTVSNFPLVGVGPNLYGCTRVDQFEFTAGAQYLTGGTATIGGAGGDGAANFTGGAVTKASGPSANVYTLTANAAYTNVTIGTGFSVALGGFTLSYNGLFTTPTGPVTCGIFGTTATSHTHNANLNGNNATAVGLANALQFSFNTYYSGRGIAATPDFIIVDNVGDNFFAGQATNEPVVTSGQYQTWQKYLRPELVSRLPNLELWGNRSDTGVTPYTAADYEGRYGEFILHLAANPISNTSETLVQTRANIIAAKANGLMVALNASYRTGSSEVEQWMLSPGPGGVRGTWADIANEVRFAGARDVVYAVALRTSSNFYGFWQPEFGTLP